MTTFPKDFLWSASTAATQIEGGWNADGKGESIWDTLVHDGTGKIAHGENADISIDFYHRWREDVALMKQMGLKAYRFSISWARVLPEGIGKVNEAGIRFYQDFCDELLKNGIQPFRKGTEEAEHLGMGLYICDLLCRKHGGTLKIANTDIGAVASAILKIS